MNKRLRTVILIVLIVIFVFSMVMLVQKLLDYRIGDTVYAEAEDIAGIRLPVLADEALHLSPAATPHSEEESGSEEDFAEDAGDGDLVVVKPGAPRRTEQDQSRDGASAVYVPDPYEEALLNADVAALHEVNSDVLGWIYIPDTNISYPLVQGDNNSFYLNHNWKGDRNSVGAIFLECQSNPDFTDFNTIIYGHRMNNGAMFTGLRKYERQNYWASHPSVYIRFGDSAKRYDIYAAYEAPVGAITYSIPISDPEKRDRFIEYGLEASAIDTGITPTRDDLVITLITCTGNGHSSRWVVQAVYSGAAE